MGTATLTGLSNEASILFNGFLQEADSWLNKFNIQGIRRVVPMGRRKAIASMGDGNFAFNKKYFNNYAITFSADEIKSIEIQKLNRKKRKDILKPKMEKAKEEYLEARETYLAIRQQKGKVSDAVTNEVSRLNEKYNKFVKEWNGIIDENKKFSSYNLWVSNNKVSKWKVGDDLSERPWSVKSYNKGGDQSMRSTTLHEFGHQIHQQFGVTTANELRYPPLEKLLTILFRKKGIVKPSVYSDTNSHEWFAENFSLYARNKKNLVDPSLRDLLEQMEKGIVKDQDTLNEWYTAFKNTRVN